MATIAARSTSALSAQPHHRTLPFGEVGVGRTPVVAAGACRRSVKMFSAIASDGTLRYRLRYGAMDRWAFLAFCAQLLRTISRPIFLIVDGSSIHTARAVGDFVARSGGRLRLFFLPGSWSYSAGTPAKH